MAREYYVDSIANFKKNSVEEIVGRLTLENDFTLEQTQRSAWVGQIEILKSVLEIYDGQIYFEYSIPRMGRRIDVVLLIGAVIFVLEFKVGEKEYSASAIDQVFDYALDLKNFHEPSHFHYIAPILIATEAKTEDLNIAVTAQNDKIIFPVRCNRKTIGAAVECILKFADGRSVDAVNWATGRYCPTPTIVEAAMALYSGHSVEEISRSDAGAKNLRQTSAAISNIIESSKELSHKTICFITGVPGAGKTLVGLNIATTHIDKANALYSVFLSGNGPLVNILCEALARDKVARSNRMGKKIRKLQAVSEVKMFVQNVHHFRDYCIAHPKAPPLEHVALFDEAQRAWDLKQTSNFMRRKKNQKGFNQSEPEFLISCLDRHSDWAVIVCLVGGGQEINTGEAGINEWVESLLRSFPNWKIHVSSQLTDSEYGAGEILKKLESNPNVTYNTNLHLGVSMRSFRAEHVSQLIKEILDTEIWKAVETLKKIKSKYSIVITRDFDKAKQWLKKQARGTERYGMVVSSQAERLKPHAINVKSPVNPIHWFLHDKSDVRSSYYLEDVATEFHVQGLELDWACVVWDADFRFSEKGWEHWAFRGNQWMHIHKEERKKYLKNAYRVLLTRARQGMVIVVPAGDLDDPTRRPKFYDATFEYLKLIGLEVL